MDTIRKVTISGESDLFNLGHEVDRVQMQAPAIIRLQFSAAGSMADILRVAASAVENNLKENASTTVTIRTDVPAMNRRHIDLRDDDPFARETNGRDANGYAYKKSSAL